MSDDYESEEAFNNDHDELLRPGSGGIKVCAECGSSQLNYRVEGRFVIRVCVECGHEMDE
jgi:hypothetical protein